MAAISSQMANWNLGSRGQLEFDFFKEEKLSLPRKMIITSAINLWTCEENYKNTWTAYTNFVNAEYFFQLELNINLSRKKTFNF